MSATGVPSSTKSKRARAQTSWSSGEVRSLSQMPDDEVLTGEAVALELQPVGFVMRALGAAIDMLATISLVILLAVVLSYSELGAAIPAALVGPIVITSIVMVLVVIPTTVETLTKGRSLGKLAVGARVVRNDGGSIGFRQAFTRALLGVLEVWMTLGGTAFLVGIFTPRAQRLGDLVAGTFSQRSRAPKFRPHPVAVPPELAGWAEIVDIGRLPVALSRRITQFLADAPRLAPEVRSHLAAELVNRAVRSVHPVPNVSPETLLLGIVAVRREREARSLELQAVRVAALQRT